MCAVTYPHRPARSRPERTAAAWSRPWVRRALISTYEREVTQGKKLLHHVPPYATASISSRHVFVSFIARRPRVGRRARPVGHGAHAPSYRPARHTRHANAVALTLARPNHRFHAERRGASARRCRATRGQPTQSPRPRALTSPAHLGRPTVRVRRFRLAHGCPLRPTRAGS